MKTSSYIILLSLFILACRQPHKPGVVKAAPITVKKQAVKSAGSDTLQSGVSPAVSRWFDSMVVVYNANTNNPLVRTAIADKNLKEEWLFDQELHADTANYYVYQVGHDVADTDGRRFVTDSWIYADTLKRMLFELQADEKLTDWRAVKP
ncbi:hypothetical protein [Mucilaginibacter pedocola]|uniref:Uncharacterized protein n=1 Tax=Mucilaginibacter pedocola TaxID=1792845 RepID=A0A1S9PMT7_9SPHI|nr:hypothetical protein [Mucilaginibacter pedocola]OOQ62241.1 hypothetical protein BC343_04140 [Mucilaginibacter pedocola]